MSAVFGNHGIRHAGTATQTRHVDVPIVHTEENQRRFAEERRGARIARVFHDQPERKILSAVDLEIEVCVLAPAWGENNIDLTGPPRGHRCDPIEKFPRELDPAVRQLQDIE